MRGGSYDERQKRGQVLPALGSSLFRRRDFELRRCWCCAVPWLAGGRARACVPKQCSVASRAVKGKVKGSVPRDGDEGRRRGRSTTTTTTKNDHTPERTHTHTHKVHTAVTTHTLHYAPTLLHAPGSLVHAHAHAQAFAALHGPSQSNPRGFVLSRSRPAVDRDLGQSRTSSICKLDAQAEAAKAGANQDGLGLRRRGGGVWRRHTGRNAGRGPETIE